MHYRNDDRERELERFKTQINLSEYAAALGYDLDSKASSRNSVGMRHTNGDKIIIGMGHDQHWVYFSVHDPADNGSIVDFDQRRSGGNLGDVRKRLRPWLSSGSSITTPLPRPPASRYVPKLEPVITDLATVRATYEAAVNVTGHHPYLTDVRGIPTALLASNRFLGRIRTDQRGNALFPHWNANKAICGFEIKNDGFTGFAKHGSKGLWCSAATDRDTRLVIAETAIDALSYAALFGYDDARFFSISGQMNPQQPGLLNRAIQAMPRDAQIIMALDHDEGGQAIGEYIAPIFEHVHSKVGREDLQLITHQPETPGHDWNDELRGDPKAVRHSNLDPRLT